jgi:ribose transport system substrate-binding protein
MKLSVKRGILGAAVLTAVLGTAVLLSGSIATASNSKVYTIYLNNSYIGNPWRQQMENYAHAIANQPQYKGHMHLIIQNSSQNTVSSQIQSLQTEIRAKPDAILIDAVSSSALNATVKQGCDAGILMYSFDQGVTEPCAYKVAAIPAPTGINMASWMAKAIHEKGDVLIDIGNAGAAYSDGMTAGLKQVMKKYPNIHIVGTYASQGNPGTELQQLSSLLTSHRNVVGVMSEAYCTGIYTAFQQAGLPQPAMGCIDINQNASFCMQKQLNCYLYTASPWCGALALVHAYKQLSGQAKYPKLTTNFNNINYVTPAGNVKGVTYVDGMTAQVLKENVSFFPKLSQDLVLPVTGQGLNLTAQNALSG